MTEFLDQPLFSLGTGHATVGMILTATIVAIGIEDITRVKQAKSELNEAIWSELEAAAVTLA